MCFHPVRHSHTTCVLRCCDIDVTNSCLENLLVFFRHGRNVKMISNSDRRPARDDKKQRRPWCALCQCRKQFWHGCLLTQVFVRGRAATSAVDSMTTIIYYASALIYNKAWCISIRAIQAVRSILLWAVQFKIVYDHISWRELPSLRAHVLSIISLQRFTRASGTHLCAIWNSRSLTTLVPRFWCAGLCWAATSVNV